MNTTGKLELYVHWLFGFPFLFSLTFLNVIFLHPHRFDPMPQRANIQEPCKQGSYQLACSQGTVSNGAEEAGSMKKGRVAI